MTITVILALNPESEEALENVKRAVEILHKRYSIKVFIVPIQLWISDPIRIENLGLPKILINNIVISSGHVPRVKDIILNVLQFIKISDKKNFGEVPAAIINDRFNFGFEVVEIYS